MTTTTSEEINISYETDDVFVKCRLQFGKGKDSQAFPSIYDRTTCSNPYTFEKFENDDKQIMYRLLAEEGPFVLSVSNVHVSSKKMKRREIEGGYITYDYGISIVVDLNTEPLYSTSQSFHPSNILRDGVPWIIKNNKSLNIDQNGKASFQWTTAKALDYGVKPTPEQDIMGVEERHKNSGMIFITIHPIYTISTHYYQEEVTRGLTRSFSSTNDVELTRSFKSQSSAARVGYGSSAKTQSISVNATAIENSRYILPIRLRIIGETSDATKCAKDLTSAIRVQELQNKTVIFPDDD